VTKIAMVCLKISGDGEIVRKVTSG